jgi:PAP2 superfamily
MEATTVKPSSGERRSWVVSVRRALIEDLPFLSLVAGFTAIAFLLSQTIGFPANLNLQVSWDRMAVFTGLYSMPAVLGFLVHAVVVKHRSLFAPATWRALVGRFLQPDQALNFFLIFASLPFFMKVLVAFKASIPIIQPFAWDVRFMEWDRLLHFGLQPWQILQPFLGRPAITQVIDFVYYLWFPVLWMTLIWQAWHGDRDSDTRSQFLVAFAASWILLGTVAATMFSSAGPVYFAAVTGATDPYAPLLGYLQVVNAQDSLTAIWAQDILWQAYTNPGTIRLEGISAMPSLHVSMVVLMTLLGFRLRRWLGWVYAAFAGLTLLGSIVLAWHYAIDGYAAAAGTLVIWWASGIVVRNWRSRIGLAPTPQIQDV